MTVSQKMSKWVLLALTFIVVNMGVWSIVWVALQIKPLHGIILVFGLGALTVAIMSWDGFMQIGRPLQVSAPAPHIHTIDQLHQSYPALVDAMLDMAFDELDREHKSELDNLKATNAKMAGEISVLRHALAQQTAESELKPGWVYLVQEKSEGHYKIGKSVTPVARIQRFDVLLPFKIDPICQIRCSNYHRTEKELHAMFADKRVGKSEWFILSDADVAFIQSLAQERD